MMKVMVKQFDKSYSLLRGKPTCLINLCTPCRVIATSNWNRSLNVKEMKRIEYLKAAFDLLSSSSKRLQSTENTRLVGTQLNYTTAAKSHITKKKMAKLTEQERSELLQPLLDVGWSMVKGRDAIYREYIFNDFNQSFRFMTGVALLAEKMNHHPEWFNVYNKLQVTMSTHDVSGLSAKDIRMAKYMEEEFQRFV